MNAWLFKSKHPVPSRAAVVSLCPPLLTPLYPPVFNGLAVKKTVRAAAELPDVVVLFTWENVQVQPCAQGRELPGIRDGEKNMS